MNLVFYMSQFKVFPGFSFQMRHYQKLTGSKRATCHGSFNLAAHFEQDPLKDRGTVAQP